LKNGNGVRIKILQSDGTLVIDRAVASDNLSTFTTTISTFGFDPGHYQCRLEDGVGKLITVDEFDITGTKKIVFEDDFSNGYSGWDSSSTADRTFSYEVIENQPVYQLKSKNTSWNTLVSRLKKLGYIGDCVIEVDSWTTLDAVVQRGIIVRSPENDGGSWDTLSFDAVGLNGGGSFGMVRVTNGKQVTLLPYTYAEVIKTKGLPNRLKVAIRGSNIEVYINGLQVATFNDPNPAGKGYVGLVIRNAQPNSPVFFDNFVVYDLK
jgi:hypothetical protein